MNEHRAWDLSTTLVSRSISFENPTGGPGAGGRAASPLGVGRKGAPARELAASETVVLCDISGNGTLRHIWMTTLPIPYLLRSFVLRAYWDGQEHPSIEMPLGDFAGFAHGKALPFQSAVHSVGENAAMNVWLEMPFVERARITLTNEGDYPAPIFYQIDYTLGDDHPPSVGRLHGVFRRENPTRLKRDFELLPERNGEGSYLGTVIGIRVTDKRWWGEGEVKFFMDGDEEFATIVGTGAEDYVGLSFGMQQTPHLYNGASYDQDSENGSHYTSMYRWHLKDPIYWRESLRVTIQQIGHKGEDFRWDNYPHQLYERQDDWSAATFWYETTPSAALRSLPTLEERTANLPPEMAPRWKAVWDALQRSSRRD